MLLATHELVGAAIGKNIQSPWIIIFLSLALHYFLDFFRHGEYLNQKSTIQDTLWKVAIDLGLGLLVIIFYILLKHPDPAIVINVFLGAFFSILPDGLTFLYWQMHMKLLKKLFEFHAWTHKYPLFSPERAWTWRNAINDILISAIAIIILFIK